MQNAHSAHSVAMVSILLSFLITSCFCRFASFMIFFCLSVVVTSVSVSVSVTLYHEHVSPAGRELTQCVDFLVAVSKGFTRHVLCAVLCCAVL